MKLDPLAEMHLLLREHGWKPELGKEGEGWTWTLPGCHRSFYTAMDGQVDDCFEFEIPYRRNDEGRYHTVDSLRRRLQELAQEMKLSLGQDPLFLRETGWEPEWKNKYLL